MEGFFYGRDLMQSILGKLMIDFQLFIRFSGFLVCGLAIGI